MSTVVWANPDKVSEEIQRGIVLDVHNQPLIGVNVIEKGNPTGGVITDVEGNFQLKLKNPNAVLQISYIGYKTMEVKAENRILKIILTEDTHQIGEVMVVGYGTQKKESVVAAITQVTSEKLKSKGIVTNITDALSGSMPGVTVMSYSGIPGGSGEHGDASAILIRGLNTWNTASPLILVDGMERDMNNLSINEIESFSVLKDASATAVFGVKGANGVILITTKRGEIGKPKVDVEINMARTKLSGIEKPVSSYEGLLVRNYAVVNELGENGDKYWGFYTPTRILNYYKDQIDPEKYPSVDWQDLMTGTGHTNSYNVQITGGTNFVRYATNLGYTSQNDILTTQDLGLGYKPDFGFNRMNFRSNLDFTITKTTNLSVNLSGYHAISQQPNEGIHNMWYGVYQHTPTAVAMYSDGTFGDDEASSDRLGNNSFYYMNTGGVEKNSSTNLTSDFILNQDLGFITKGLSIKGRFSYDNMLSTFGSNIVDNNSYVRKIWNSVNNEWEYDIPQTGSDGFDWQRDPLTYNPETINTDAASDTRRNIYYEAQLNYNRRFGDHNITFLGLFSREYRATGSTWPHKREDWAGRVAYDLKGRYLAEVNGAYNGSEKFGPGYKFDFFPSLALGWRVSEEKLVREKLPWVSNLKLKYSVGEIGNDNLTGVGQWPYMTAWTTVGPNDLYGNDVPRAFGYPYPVTSPYKPMYTEGTPGNPDIRWEKALKKNYGIEAGIFKDMITGNVDFFNDHRYDMLVAASQRSISDIFGQTPPAANIGIVDSKGVEIEVKFNKRFKNLMTWASWNWTHAQNEIKYKEDADLLPFYQKLAGYAINQVRSGVNTGIIKNWDEMYTGTINQQSSGNVGLVPGDYRQLDFDSDGLISVNDGVPYGFTQYPQKTYGFSFGAEYKGFAFSMQFYGAYDVTLNIYQIAELQFNAPLAYQSYIDRTFTPEYGNADADYRSFRIARATSTGDYMLFDGSFLRLKSAELSYTLPKKWTEKLSMSSIKLVANGNNLYMWTKLPLDIEENMNEKMYPNVMQINFGLRASF